MISTPIKFNISSTNSSSNSNGILTKLVNKLKYSPNLNLQSHQQSVNYINNNINNKNNNQFNNNIIMSTQSSSVQQQQHDDQQQQQQQQEEEDPPMPEFECDWLNDQISINLLTSNSNSSSTNNNTTIDNSGDRISRKTGSLLSRSLIDRARPDENKLNDNNNKRHDTSRVSLDHYKSPELASSSSINRSLLQTRNSSADRISSSSQPPVAETDSMTPGLPRASLNAASSKRIGIATKWKTTVTSNGKPLRKAGRVVRTDQESAEDAESEGGNQTTSPEGQDQSLTAPDSPPMMYARPRPASIIVPLPKLPNSTSASSLSDHPRSISSSAINPSAYIHRDASTRSRSAMANYRSASLLADSSSSDTPPMMGGMADESNTSNSPALGPSTSATPQLVASSDPAITSTQTREESSTLPQRGRLQLEGRSSTDQDKESTILPNHRSGERGAGRSISSNGNHSREPSPTENGSGSDRRTMSAATMRQSQPASSSTIDQNRSQQSDQRHYAEFQDENQYTDSRPGYNFSSRQQSQPLLQHQPLSTPSYTTSNFYQQQQQLQQSQSQGPPLSNSVNGRTILGETYRGTNLPQQQSQQQFPIRSSKSSSSNSYSSQPRDTQAPLRDRSPGVAEATPSQNNYYQSNHHQQQQQQPQSSQDYQMHQSQQQHHHQQQQQRQQQQYQHPQQQPPIAPIVTKKKVAAPLYVNGIAYHRAGLLGKGGSSRVYRVLDASNNLFAIKRVDIGRNDAETRASFLNEIQLLEKLKGKPQIIRLIDSEMNEAKKTLMMVMEVGEIDLNGLLADHLGKRISMNFIRYIWEQMLEAVQVIHDENVVHTDLKPANFVLVKGHLKLIDFGISKAIANDTTNIGRDQQIGTANYMPPEALMDSGMGLGGKRLMKLGRAADVWSLGCILHQMVYGHTPFSHFKDISRKILAIQNPLHVITFAEMACPLDERGEGMKDLAVIVGEELREDMRGCLRFEAKDRRGILDLLRGGFLRGSMNVAENEEIMKDKPPTVDEATMKLLVDRVTKSVTGKVLSNEDGRMMALKLMNELRAANQPNR